MGGGDGGHSHSRCARERHRGADARAARLGLSRGEYVCRRLAEDATRDDSPAGAAQFARFAEIFSDLSDPEVLSQAWR